MWPQHTWQARTDFSDHVKILAPRRQGCLPCSRLDMKQQVGCDWKGVAEGVRELAAGGWALEYKYMYMFLFVSP